jgi:ribose 5-phosphate isomerase B
MQVGDLEALVRRVVGRALAERGRPPADRASGIHVEVRPSGGAARPRRPPPELESSRGPRAGGAWLVTAEDLADVPDGGALRVPAGARVTPLAREEAFRRRIHLGAGLAPPGEGCPRAGEPLRVAVGSDHGGFARKADVLAWLRELGHRPLDLGTHDENAVDYPDVAAKVAVAVAEGRADVGVLLDGAGIGSAMAANKVSGIRAANCHDPRMAQNAREHNHANVLTLGARMIDRATTHEVLRTFLATPWGGERHRRRVEKLAALERARRGQGEPGGPAAGA